MKKSLLKKKKEAFLFSLLSFFLVIGSTALAQEAPPLPPDFDPNAEGTSLDMSQSIELTPVLPPGSVSQEEAKAIEQQAQESEGEVAEVDFPTFIQGIKDLPGAPSVLQTIQTEEELNALSQEQQEEVQTFMQNLFSPGDLASSSEDIPGTTSCFEHYRFGSVQTNIYSMEGKTSFQAGTTQYLTTSILNENSYPIINGSVYVKLYRVEDDVDMSQGYDVVDQRFVIENIDLNKEAEVTKEITYTFPEYLPQGNYKLVSYFSSDHKYNLLGLPFTDDVLGNSQDIAIENDKELGRGIFFDKNKVSVDGNPYFFAAYTPKVDKEKTIDIQTTLVNSLASQEEVTITWSLYGWDQQDERNLISQEQEMFTLGANEEKSLLYQVDEIEANYAVYLLVADAQYQDAHSIANIRFTREDMEALRINFPTILDFPLKKGQENALFSCLHGAGTKDITEGAKLTLTLTDENDKIIKEHIYKGPVSGAMMATKEVFTPKKDYQKVTLSAQLEKEGRVLDASTFVYDCSAIEGLACEEVLESSLFEKIAPIIVIVIVGGALLFLLLKITKKKKRTASKPKRKSSRGKMAIFLFFFLSLGVMGGGNDAEAASVTSTATYGGMLTYQSTMSLWYTNWFNALSWPTISASYWAGIYKWTPGGDVVVNPGATINVGDWIRFGAGYGGISYTGTGYTADTPEGYWVWGAGWPNGSSPGTVNLTWWGGGTTARLGNCNVSRIGRITDYRLPGYAYNVYIPLSVHPAGAYLGSFAGSTLGLYNRGDGWYQVRSPGVLKSRFDFPATYAKFYYEYYADVYGRCFRTWDQLPLSNTHINLPTKNIQYNISAVCPSGTVWNGSSCATPVNGSCGTADGVQSSTFPGANLCASGTASATDNQGTDGNWNWDCNGANTGTNASCSAPSYSCTGTAPDNTRTTVSSANETTGLTANTPWQYIDTQSGDQKCEYECISPHTWNGSSCVLDGTCGTSNGGSEPFWSDLSANACGTGTLNGPTLSGDTWSWTCNGQYGGINASCSATRTDSLHIKLDQGSGCSTATDPGSILTMRKSAQYTLVSCDQRNNDVDNVTWTNSDSSCLLLETAVPSQVSRRIQSQDTTCSSTLSIEKTNYASDTLSVSVANSGGGGIDIPEQEKGQWKEVTP